jgi:hypothetical protein
VARLLDKGPVSFRAERNRLESTGLQGIVYEAVQREALAEHLHLDRRAVRSVLHVGLAEAGDESPFGLQRAALTATVGAEDVYPAVMVGDRLGILRLDIVRQYRMEALYLPALAYLGATLVPEDGDAVLDLTIVQDRPERQLPPVRPQQRVVLDYEQPRRLVRVQVQLEPV